jgi:phenylacetate-CoA ligase
MKFYSQLEENQYMEQEDLRQKSWLKIKDLIEFAYDNSTFYRRSFDDAGVMPGDIKDPEDFSKIPILTRETIRENFNSIKVKNVESKWFFVQSTGGSTGVPVKVLIDNRVPIKAVAWRMRRWWGCQPWDNGAFVSRKTHRALILYSYELWPRRRIFLNASMMTETDMSRFARCFNLFGPSFLRGYVGALFEFAEFLLRKGISIKSPKAVYAAAAPLSQGQRRVIESAFCSPVYSQYGTNEVPLLASECKEQDGLHIFSDIRYMEFLKDNETQARPGETGDIVITDLENRVFPIIRYKIGDKGSCRSTCCSCGVRLPLMENVIGRINDTVRLPGGEVMFGLSAIFDQWPLAVRNFQIYQHSNGNITLKCVPGSMCDAISVIKTVGRMLQKKVGTSVTVQVEIVEKISHDRGKTRYIISEAENAGTELIE